MRRANKQLFGKFISNNLAAFSKSQWRYPAGTLLLCSVASAAYYHAEQSKKIIADNNQDLKPVEVKDCDDASSETSPRGLRPMDLSYVPKLNVSDVLGEKPRQEVWDFSEYKHYEKIGMFKFDKPVNNKLTLDELVEGCRLVD